MTERRMDRGRQRRLIESLARAILASAEELTTLDQAIGDGDHGLNMKRGFEAVLAQLDALADRPLPEAAEGIGTTLVMKVGGASGPLYGTLFRALGKELPVDPAASDAARALGAAIAAVKKLGKSEVGQKTMLDVLSPVQEELSSGGAGLAGRLRLRAEAAALATVPMRATKGRASFLGERSIGHMDPGARSSWLLVAAVCDALEE
jgi:dihydroxyacetone kinase-like protein